MKFAAVLLLAGLLVGCTPALTEGVAGAGDAAARLWLIGRGANTCSAPPPAPVATPAARPPTVDEILAAMAYGAAVQRQADAAAADARELQRVAADLLADRARAAAPAPAASASAAPVTPPPAPAVP